MTTGQLHGMAVSPQHLDPITLTTISFDLHLTRVGPKPKYNPLIPPSSPIFSSSENTIRQRSDNLGIITNLNIHLRNIKWHGHGPSHHSRELTQQEFIQLIWHQRYVRSLKALSRIQRTSIKYTIAHQLVLKSHCNVFHAPALPRFSHDLIGTVRPDDNFGLGLENFRWR